MSAAHPVKLGIIGAGDIFPAYAKGLQAFGNVQLIAVADARHEAAEARAAEFGIAAMTPQRMLESEAEIIINLTPPAAHLAVGRQVLLSGRHLYTEKPLAASFEEGQVLLECAARSGRRVACAPDTFLGGAGQAARALVDSGRLGRIVAGQACMMERGPDDWHPNPAFFYRRGAGPLMDMGVYYLTQLVQLLGPVRRVSGMAHTSWPQRSVPRGPRQGQSIEVETPTHIVAGLEFDDGAFVTLSTSFDVWKHRASPIELYGEHGTVVLPDPNQFGGALSVSEADGDWQDLAPCAFTGRLRGLGVAEMAWALRADRPHRASGELALHVLEIMDATLRSAATASPVLLGTRCPRPEPLPAGFASAIGCEVPA